MNELAENLAKEKIDDWSQWHERCKKQVIELMVEFQSKVNA